MDKKEVMTLMNCSLNDNLSLDKGELTNYMDGMSHNTADNTVGWDGHSDDNKVQAFGDGLYSGSGDYTCWEYWRNDYYPRIIRESYPVYIQERAKDKGKQAFEIIKILKDKKLVHLKTVGDFIDLMDELIKIL